MSGAWPGSTRRARLPPNWPQIRRAVLERDRYVCHVCGRAGADEVDHVQSGDDHRPSNLAAIHAVPCHRRKSSSEGNASRWRYSDRRPEQKHPGLL